MFFVLYGEDAYRSKEKLNEIIQQYKEKNKKGFNLFFFNFEKDADFDDVEIAIRQVSMFAEKRLFVISEFFNFGTEDKQEKMINFLKKEKGRGGEIKEKAEKRGDEKEENTFFIFFETAKTINAQNKLFKFLKKENGAKMQEFKLLKGEDLYNWTEKEFLRYNIRGQKNVLKFFLNFVGNDSWRIKNEINKLVNYCRDKQKVEIDDIKLLISPEIDNNIFNTIEAIANKEESKALKLINNHIQKGDNELYILSMIAYQFKILLTIKDLVDRSKNYDEIGKELKLHPFVLKKNYKLTNFFTREKLKDIYNKILEIDLKIKQGMSPQLGIDLFILKLKI